MTFLTALILAATVANVVVFYLESEDSSQKIETLSKKAGGIVDSMNIALAGNQKAIDKAFEVNRKAVEASNQQSRKSLDASIQASHRDQRAWVSVRSCILAKEPEQGEGFRVNCRIEDTGKTPAVSIRNSFLTGSSNFPPPSQDWSQVTASAPFILFPGDTGRGYAAIFAIHDSPPIERATDLNSILFCRRSINRMWVWAHLTYEDVFGGKHFTDSCMNRMFGSPLTDFIACDTGNDVDRDQTK